MLERSGLLDLRTQAEIHSALKTDTPKYFRVNRKGKSLVSTAGVATVRPPVLRPALSTPVRISR
jgi:hypothetical protein